MDKNLEMGPRADKKFEKRNLEGAKYLKNRTLKVSDPLSPSLRGDPPAASAEENGIVFLILGYRDTKFWNAGINVLKAFENLLNETVHQMVFSLIDELFILY